MKSSNGLLALTAVAAALMSPAVGAAEDDTVALWNKQCASCHGADGKAQTKMGKVLKVEDLTTPEARAEFDRDKMIASTTNGVLKADGKTPWMPGFGKKLTSEQIATLVDYVRDGFGQTAPATE